MTVSKNPTKCPTEVDRFIAQRIRTARIAAGISQETLGRGLGITFQQVQKCEKGTNRISAGRLFQIATLLKVPVAEFFDGLKVS